MAVKSILDLSPSVQTALQLTANYLGFKPEWLFGIIYNESRWNPKAVNPISNAIGLIQFMPTTLAGMKLDRNKIAEMSIEQQLSGPVKEYLKPYRGKIKDMYDAYLTVFYPAAIGKPDSYVFGSEKSEQYAGLVSLQNPVFKGTGKQVSVFDKKSGKNVTVKLVSKADFKRYVDGLASNLGITVGSSLIGIFLLGLLAFLYFR